MICSKKIPKKAYIYAESEVDAKCEGIEGEVLKYILSLLLHNILNNIYIIDHLILFIRRKIVAKNDELYKNHKTPQTCLN